MWLVEETFVRVHMKNLITLGVFATTLLLQFRDRKFWWFLIALIVRCLCLYTVWLARLARNCHTLILGKDRDFLISCCFLLFLLDPIFDRPFAT